MAWSRHADVVWRNGYHITPQLFSLSNYVRTLWLCCWLRVIHVRQRNVWRLMFDLSNQPWNNHPSVYVYLSAWIIDMSRRTRRRKEAPNRMIKLVIHLRGKILGKILASCVSSLKKTRPEQSNCPNCTSSLVQYLHIHLEQKTRPRAILIFQAISADITCQQNS